MHKVPPRRFLLFILVWSVMIYIPVARWSWYRDGWSSRILHAIDFAGGGPVHIVSGSTVAAFSVFYAIELNQSWGEFLGETGKFLKALMFRYTRDLFRPLWSWILQKAGKTANSPGADPES